MKVEYHRNFDFMKTRLLFTLFTLLLLESCQSEFDRQIQTGKVLIEKEIQLQQSVQLDGLTNSHVSTIKSLNEELNFHAHLSGNQALFIQELHAYRETKINAIHNQELLITKYP